jgi:exodeoxyribonuclease V alpha subunit
LGQPLEVVRAVPTRGKRLVVLVGTKKALGMAIRRADTRHRYTALRRRLQESSTTVLRK